MSSFLEKLGYKPVKNNNVATSYPLAPEDTPVATVYPTSSANPVVPSTPIPSALLNQNNTSFLNKTYGLNPTQPVNPARSNYVEAANPADLVKGSSAAYSNLLDQKNVLGAEADVFRTGINALGQEVTDAKAANIELQKKLDAKQENVTGPGRTMSNVLAGGTLGLGVASFLDNRKTAKLQRSAMKENLQMARDDQAARKRRTAGWANAFGGNE